MFSIVVKVEVDEFIIELTILEACHEGHLSNWVSWAQATRVKSLWALGVKVLQLTIFLFGMMIQSLFLEHRAWPIDHRFGVELGELGVFMGIVWNEGRGTLEPLETFVNDISVDGVEVVVQWLKSFWVVDSMDVVGRSDIRSLGRPFVCKRTKMVWVRLERMETDGLSVTGVGEDRWSRVLGR